MTNEYQDILDCLKRKDQMITKKSIESENYLSLLHRAMKLLDEQQRREQRQGPSGASDDASASAGGTSKPQLSEKGSAPAAPPNHESEAFAVAHGESAQSDG